jgi:hypothetical protein
MPIGYGGNINDQVWMPLESRGKEQKPPVNTYRTLDDDRLGNPLEIDYVSVCCSDSCLESAGILCSAEPLSRNLYAHRSYGAFSTQAHLGLCHREESDNPKLPLQLHSQLRRQMPWVDKRIVKELECHQEEMNPP